MSNYRVYYRSGRSGGMDSVVVPANSEDGARAYFNNMPLNGYFLYAVEV